MSMSSKIRHRCFSNLIITFLFSKLLNMTESVPIKERSIHSCLENTSTPFYNVDETTFCQCCGPGFYKVDDCEISGEKAICMPCNDGYYSNTSNQAIVCSLCFYPPKCHRPNMEITQTCTRTTNFDCRCKDGYFFKHRQGSNGDGDCVKQTCPQGTYIDLHGTSESVCKSCENVPDTESDDYKKSCSNLRHRQKCDPKEGNNCSDVTNKPINKQSDDSSAWIWIIVTFAVSLASIITAVIVLYCFRRSGVFDIVKFVSEHISRRKVSREDESSNDEPRFFTDTIQTDDVVAFIDEGTTSNLMFTDIKEDERSNYAEIPVHPNGVEGIIQHKQTIHLERTEGKHRFQDHEASECQTQYIESTRKQWKKCIRWLANIIDIKSWRPIIRYLFDELDSDRDGDSIIEEVVANHPNDVREQIYRAFIKWYQLTDPRKISLNVICEVLEEKKECELEQNLKTKFSDLLKEEPDIPTEG